MIDGIPGGPQIHAIVIKQDSSQNTQREQNI